MSITKINDNINHLIMNREKRSKVSFQLVCFTPSLSWFSLEVHFSCHFFIKYIKMKAIMTINIIRKNIENIILKTIMAGTLAKFHQLALIYLKLRNILIKKS